MEKDTYQILIKKIPEVKLVSLTSQNWYDSKDELVEWSGSVYIGPNQNDIVYNVTGSLSSGYYKWTGTTWNQISKSLAYDSFNIPIFLNSTIDELGGFVEFDGQIEQIEQVTNFTYTQTGNTIQIYGTTNPNKLRKIIEQTFTIDWGDGTSDTLTVNEGVEGDLLPTLSKTYSTNSGYTISIILQSPWSTEKLSKNIKVPKWDMITSNPMGTFTGMTIPAYSNLTGQTQDYIFDYDYTSGYTGYTNFSYAALGRSRISEKKLYGSEYYTGVTIGSTDGIIWSGYTIEDLYYRDYEDGYTTITGTTSGFTKEEVFDTLLTRNEHFLGFIEDPTIFSDVFVERGKQNVSEKNLRLNEIDSISEIEIYGNGYFNIRNQ